MSIGLRGKETRIFNYPRALRAKKRGFTLAELLIASLIFSVILAALFITLNIGQLSFSTSSAKIGVQSQVRLAMDWLIKDLRQAISWNIASISAPYINDPTTTHLKFNLWSWNSGTSTWDLSADFIEYNYDAVAEKLTRVYYNDTTKTTMTLEFDNIVEAPFYTAYIDAGNPANILDADQLRINRRLIIVINGQKLVRSGLFVPFNLKSEVKIRNGD